MKEIEQVVGRYLQEKDTDYAIMITGEWGCGKTYYVQHTLKKIIENKYGIDGSQKKTKKKMVYISLYGLSCVDNLPNLIFRNAHKFVDYKIFKAVHTVTGGAADYVGAGKDNVKQLFQNFYDIKDDKVLVFDDLERINYEKISVKEVLGAINQYAEVKKLKVILVSDEDKMNNDYNEFKEKTIRYSIKFKRSLSESFDVVIPDVKDADYKVFLTEQKALLLEVFEKGKCNNLRTFLFAIDAFKEIFTKVKEGKYKTEILKTLLVSFLIYTIEYKSGKKQEDLDELSKLRQYWLYSDRKKDKEPTYIDELYDKYGQIRHEYNHYPVIIEYITNGYLDNNELNVIINDINNECVRNAETVEGVLLRKFTNWDQIEDDKFSEYIKELIQCVQENKYSIRELTTLYYQLLKIDYYEIDNFKLDDHIDKIFKDSANIVEHNEGFNLYIETDIFEFTPLHYGEKLDERYKSFINYIEDINRELRAVGEQKIIDGFLTDLKSGDYDKIIDYGKGSNFQFVIEHIDAKSVFDILKDSNKDVVEAFRYNIYCRYPDRVIGLNVSENEICFIKDLKELINQYLNQLQVKRMSSVWYQLLGKKLDDILQSQSVND